MPILSKEPSIFPDSLLEELPQTDDDRQWWVLHTKARQEKAVARQLLVMECPFYLPLISKPRYYQGRKLTAHVPVFDSYVFLYGTVDERYESLTTNRVAHVVPVKDGERLQKDLSNIKRLIESKAKITIESRLEPGQWVRVKNGPFRGVEGQIVARRKEHRLLVSIDFLQKGVSVEIDDFMVEPL